MKNYFKGLFKFNEWANHRYLVCLEEADVKNDRLPILLGHLISSQIVWLHRIKDLPTSPFPLWEHYKLRELRSMLEESTTNWTNYLEDHRFETFEEMIFYKNSKGVKYENTIGQIITHVIHHGTYHRSQMAVLMKEENLIPPITDFIAYARLNS